MYGTYCRHLFEERSPGVGGGHVRGRNMFGLGHGIPGDKRGQPATWKQGHYFSGTYSFQDIIEPAQSLLRHSCHLISRFEGARGVGT